jgi:AcrR family transcriptional regulator
VSSKQAAGLSKRSKSSRRHSYHHGDLKSALIETAVELIGEHGVRDFSLAEATRRLGVASSAPYAHFSDRDDLLAAVAVHALQSFEAGIEVQLRKESDPKRRLGAISHTYVRFAGKNEALFRTLFEAELNKKRHSEIARAEERIDGVFRASVREATDSADDASVEALAAAVEATAHGFATLLLDGRFGKGRKAIDQVCEAAARATAALIEGRKHLTEKRAS